MDTDNADTTEDSLRAAYAGGFVSGLLTARYYALRHPITAGFFQTPVPDQTPDVVYSLLSNMCRAAVDENLFKKSWDSLDRLLLCDSPQELEAALSIVPDASLQ
jgi:hypothetical protein